MRADEHGILLQFDEVMTSRLGPGGLQKTHAVTPDMTSFGKYLGGGLTFGAFGGKAEVMSRFDPRAAGHFGHAGTFNNNVLTMQAAIAGLTEVFTETAAEEINAPGRPAAPPPQQCGRDPQPARAGDRPRLYDDVPPDRRGPHRPGGYRRRAEGSPRPLPPRDDGARPLCLPAAA